MANEETQIHLRVQFVFQQIFEDSTLQVSGEATAEDIPGWDSLTHIGLILALEEEFDIQFSSAEVTSMACVGDLFTMLAGKEKGNGQA